MKDKDIVSNDLINDIFYKIPEIHIHHTAFLISLSQKLSQWDNKETVGDILLQMVKFSFHKYFFDKFVFWGK